MSRPHISGRPIKSKGALNLWLTNHGYPPTYGGRSWSDYSQPDLRTLTQEAFPNEKVPQSKTKIYYINALVTADRLTDNRTARRLSLAQAAMHQPMEPLPQDPKQRRPTPSPVPEFFYPSSLSRAPRKARSTAVAESESDLVSSDDELPLQKRVRRSSPILESAIDSSDDMPIQKRVRRSSPIPESAIDSSDDMQIQKRVRRISPVASLSPGPEDLDESASEVDSVGHDQTMADSGDDSDSSASSLATLSMSQSRAQPNRQRPAQAPVRAKSSAPYDIPQQGTHRATLGARNGFEASAASAESTPRTLISHPESNRSDIKHQSIATWNCPTCFDDFEPNEVPALAVDARCQHASMTICGTCLQEYITAQSTSTRLDSIVCPIEACNATLSYNQMRMYATKEVFLRYDNEIARNALQGSEDYLECANVKCSHRGFVNPEMSFITCSCGTRTCVDCCTAWHPDQTHEENMAEIERAKEREREVAEQGSAKYLAAKTKACPSCGSHIIKSTGCDHMRCLARLRTKEGYRTCNHEFCYLCLASHRLISAQGNHMHRQGCQHYRANVSSVRGRGRGRGPIRGSRGGRGRSARDRIPWNVRRHRQGLLFVDDALLDDDAEDHEDAMDARDLEDAEDAEDAQNADNAEDAEDALDAQITDDAEDAEDDESDED